MAIFNSYVSLPEGKPPFSYGFPMVFLWFSYGFPVVHPHISHITRAAESVATSRGASGAASADRVTYNAVLAACRNASRWIEVANGAMNVRKKRISHY